MIDNKLFFKPLFFSLMLCLLVSKNLMAQDNGTAASSPNKWTFIVEPYMMFPNMKGSVGLGDLPNVTVDADSNAILGHLKMGFMLNAEASTGKWTIGSDFLYMDLAQGVKPGVLIANGELSAKQLGWEVSGLHNVTPWLELGLGGLLNSVNSGLDINQKVIGGGTASKSKSMTKTWFDPMLIARVNSKSGEKIIYQFRGEIGGFGIGSDLAWQMQAYAGYRFSKLFQITAGYRVISLDYETGSGGNRFMYNVDTSGLVARFGFNF
ncbi:hypothetical protein [Flavobacterium limnophilum]|uniref:hypothetical protein n=1 Tax=Flavobacterium limnophilum TaxID=3003262 RepID=UPI0024829599|nr:hypothetical protein [Flavobacterium limnophilum]